MSIKTILAIGSAFIAAGAFAQAQTAIGTVESVQGLVTVTDGVTGGTATAGSPIKSGMRFVSTSTGSAVLRMKNDCVIRLQPSQAVTVLDNTNCRELLAGVRSVGTQVAAAGSVQTGALATGGLLAGALVLDKTVIRNKSASLSSH